LTITVVSQNLDSDDLGGFGNTEWSRNSGSSTVSAVTVSILVPVSAEGCSPRGASIEGGVIYEDTGICWTQ